MSSNKFYGIFIQKNGDKSERSGTGTCILHPIPISLPSTWIWNVFVDEFSQLSDKVHVYTSVDDVLKTTKEFNNARFKYFATEEEATYFAINGSTSGPGNPSVQSESTPFKSLKREDIQILRGFIERDAVKEVESRVWENPRYLIGIGDTPTLMRVSTFFSFYPFLKSLKLVLHSDSHSRMEPGIMRCTSPPSTTATEQRITC